jgi:hypothetical protein
MKSQALNPLTTPLEVSLIMLPIKPSRTDHPVFEILRRAYGGRIKQGTVDIAPPDIGFAVWVAIASNGPLPDTVFYHDGILNSSLKQQRDDVMGRQRRDVPFELIAWHLASFHESTPGAIPHALVLYWQSHIPWDRYIKTMSAAIGWLASIMYQSDRGCVVVEVFDSKQQHLTSIGQRTLSVYREAGLRQPIQLVTATMITLRLPESATAYADTRAL